MASPGVEYLGVMAWAAQFQWIPDKIGPGELAEVRLGGNKCRVGEKVEFVIEVPDKGEVGLDKLEAEVTGPGGPVGNMEFDPRDGKGSFTPREYGNLLKPTRLLINLRCMMKTLIMLFILRHARGSGDERGRGGARLPQLCEVDAKLKEGLRRHRALCCWIHCRGEDSLSLENRCSGRIPWKTVIS